MNGPEALFDDNGETIRLRPERRLKTSFALEWLDQIEPQPDAPDFVEGLLTSAGLAVLYGASNVGKTFLAGDLALHVAAGWSWFGREIDGGLVVYIAAEGGSGIRNRVAAFKRHHDITGADIPFALIASAINLLDPRADTERLIEDVAAVAKASGLPVRLIVVDTLSRALAGGAENMSEDMGSLVRNADRIRAATGAAVVFVHHSGKTEAAGSRGHSLLRAALDTELEVTRDEATKIATCTTKKLRDLPEAEPFSFKLQVVELGTNRRGKPVTSCVVVPTDAAPKQKPAAKLKPDQRLALDALRDAVIDFGAAVAGERIPRNAKCITLDQWRERLRQRGHVEKGDRMKWKRLKDGLQGAGLIGIWEEQVWEVRP